MAGGPWQTTGPAWPRQARAAPLTAGPSGPVCPPLSWHASEPHGSGGSGHAVASRPLNHLPAPGARLPRFARGSWESGGARLASKTRQTRGSYGSRYPRWSHWAREPDAAWGPWAALRPLGPVAAPQPDRPLYAGGSGGPGPSRHTRFTRHPCLAALALDAQQAGVSFGTNEPHHSRVANRPLRTRGASWSGWPLFPPRPC